MFLVEVTYKKSISEVDRMLVAHRNYLESHYQRGNLIFSGPQNPRIGGMILTRFKNRAEVEDFTRLDPFCLEGIASYRIIEFDPVKHDSQFKVFLT